MLIEHGTFIERYVRESSQEQLKAELRDLIERGYSSSGLPRRDVTNPGVYFLRSNRDLAYDSRERLTIALTDLACARFLAPEVASIEPIIARYIECLTPAYEQFAPHRDRVARSLLNLLEQTEGISSRLRLLCLNGLCSIRAQLDDVSTWFDLADLTNVYPTMTAVDGACYQSIHEGLRIAAERLTKKDQIRWLLESLITSFQQLLDRHGTTAVATGVWNLRKTIPSEMYAETINRIDATHKVGLGSLLVTLSSSEPALSDTNNHMITEPDLNDRLIRFQDASPLGNSTLDWVNDAPAIKRALRCIELDSPPAMRRGLRLLKANMQYLSDKSATRSLLGFLLRDDSPMQTGLPELVDDFPLFFREIMTLQYFDLSEIKSIITSLQLDATIRNRLVKEISLISTIPATERLYLLDSVFSDIERFAFSIPTRLLLDAIDEGVLDNFERRASLSQPVRLRLDKLPMRRIDSEKSAQMDEREVFQHTILANFPPEKYPWNKR